MLAKNAKDTKEVAFVDDESKFASRPVTEAEKEANDKKTDEIVEEVDELKEEEMAEKNALGKKTIPQLQEIIKKADPEFKFDGLKKNDLIEIIIAG